jgi:hypothetical protein
MPKIVAIDKQYNDDARALLDEAQKENFDFVCIIGSKEDSLYFKTSKTRDVYKMLGMIEMLKSVVIRNAK